MTLEAAQSRIWCSKIRSVGRLFHVLGPLTANNTLGHKIIPCKGLNMTSADKTAQNADFKSLRLGNNRK